MALVFAVAMFSAYSGSEEGSYSRRIDFGIARL
jgi:hypothetical protein